MKEELAGRLRKHGDEVIKFRCDKEMEV